MMGALHTVAGRVTTEPRVDLAMTQLNQVPVHFQSADGEDANLSIAKTALNEIRVSLEQLVHSGKPAAIDLRALPWMSAATYDYLKEALSAGEVTATVNADLKVEIRETQYPGVWWLTHRNRRGAIVTELIEITQCPEILKTHQADIRAGLKRIEQVLATSAPQ
jgi:hydrogenase-1 operon protein HyaF